MVEIKQFYRNTIRLINQAESENTLDFLHGVALKEKSKYNNLDFKPSIRKQAIKVYNRIKKAISLKRLKLRR